MVDPPSPPRISFTLDALEVLDAIDRHKSFAGAATELHRAPSAVSYAVKQLEDSLGIGLFDRSGHRAVLTAAGRLVLDEGRTLLSRARRIETLATRLHEEWESHIRIVVDGILPMDPVLAALRSLADDAVPTHIDVRVEFLGGVQDRFERDRADLMLVKDYSRDASLEEHPLGEIEVVLAVAQGHVLAREERVSLEDLHRHVELTVHDSSESKRILDTRIFGGDRVFYLSDFSMKKRAIALGLGFGWVPVSLVEEELRSGAFVVLPYEGGGRYSFVPVLVHPKERPLGRAGRAFFERVVSAWA